MAGKAVQRKGDPDSGGGLIIGGESSVLINGRPAAYPFLSVTPHPPCPTGKLHCVAKTTMGATSVKVNGKPLLLAGNPDTCGHTRIGGSPNVKAV